MDIKTEISNPIAYRDTAHRLTSLIAPPSYTRTLVQRKMPIKITAKAKLEWFFFGSWASSSIDFVSFILRPLPLLLVSLFLNQETLPGEEWTRSNKHYSLWRGNPLTLSLSWLAYVQNKISNWHAHMHTSGRRSFIYSTYHSIRPCTSSYSIMTFPDTTSRQVAVPRIFLSRAESGQSTSERVVANN